MRRNYGKDWVSYTIAGALVVVAKTCYDGIYSYVHYRLATQPRKEEVVWSHLGTFLLTSSFDSNDTLKERFGTRADKFGPVTITKDESKLTWFTNWRLFEVRLFSRLALLALL